MAINSSEGNFDRFPGKDIALFRGLRRATDLAPHAFPEADTTQKDYECERQGRGNRARLQRLQRLGTATVKQSGGG